MMYGGIDLHSNNSVIAVIYIGTNRLCFTACETTTRGRVWCSSLPDGMRSIPENFM